MEELCKVYYPNEFNSEVIKVHPNFEKELIGIIKKSGFENDFAGLYSNRLKELEKRMEDCIIRRNWFEKLKYTKEDLYSMIFKSKKNIRILFAFINFKDKKYVVLLYSFEEKDNNKNSKNSYETAKLIALKRLEEVIHHDES